LKAFHLAFALLVLALASPAGAQEPEFPALTGRVVDQADLLSESTERELSRRLARWEEQSSDQVVIVTLESLDGLEIEDYGYRLGRAWGIGVDEGTDGRGLDNGAILIVAPNERAVRIEVGYGLEPTLTDAMSGTIIRRGILPSFREGRFEEGIVQGTEGILSVLAGEPAEWMDRRERAGGREIADGEGGVPWPLVLFLLLFVLPSVLRGRRGVVFDSDRSRRRGYRGGTGDALAWIIASEIGRHAGRGGGSWGGGGGFGGGGFSGGGGGFGGGGASGSW
jgi:uncharacterized protein